MPTTFSELADAYLSQRIVSDVYAANVRRIAGRCGPVSNSSLNGFIQRRAAERKGTTVRSERSIMLSVWRWAFDQGLIDVSPRGIAKVKGRRAPTQAWTPEQMKRLVDLCCAVDHERLRGGARLGQLLRAWILLGYESGSRFGDLWKFTGDNLNGDAIQWTQSKTGDGITRLLSRACLEACQVMLERSTDGRILGWACRKRQAMRLFHEHLERCGLPGSSKWLRRSGATHIEIAEPGKAKLHLGHRTPGLAETNYLDWSQIRKHAPRTPALLD